MKETTWNLSTVATATWNDRTLTIRKRNQEKNKTVLSKAERRKLFERMKGAYKD